MMRPQETVRFTLDELLPGREGTAVVEVRDDAPGADRKPSSALARVGGPVLEGLAHRASTARTTTAPTMSANRGSRSASIRWAAWR